MMTKAETLEGLARAIFFRGGEQDDAQWDHMQPRYRFEAREAAVTAYDFMMVVFAQAEREADL